ncbi:hypothetical protein NEMIN01_0429 [Nematocida minor]|uniref:uncharacterized protein n=1 Tax=Nematocida minor TaxID=1912983 RepID=UPI00221E7CFF|nr:uncharacterized protein NEMIN01_0429 [Nematocida minor]KAI5189366.1 hypothetical protein NEMIN01_0429 [Nematocida minor]
MLLYTIGIELLSESIFHLSGLFITLWLAYVLREALISYVSPKCKPSDVSNILPPTCHIKKPQKRPYDV